jgi:hypothetical protein
VLTVMLVSQEKRLPFEICQTFKLSICNASERLQSKSAIFIGSFFISIANVSSSRFELFVAVVIHLWSLSRDDANIQTVKHGLPPVNALRPFAASSFHRHAVLS